jgi:hypothetical protein
MRFIYQSKVLYKFNPIEGKPFLCKVKGGFICETPETMPWIRGFHLKKIESYFKTIEPLQIVTDVY